MNRDLPEPLTFIDWALYHAPAAGAIVLLVLCIVVPALIHLNRKGY